jgi:hypothetical protein
MLAAASMHQLPGLHVHPESIDRRRISMSDDDFGDEDEIIVFIAGAFVQ